ncbi:hypothetical protein AVEN_84954-1 [Araneus ventricosus]|uniref:Uncharacterized protein n=1 Tax=Araneus ventricosus TaxID=182803 RepID=A0A4Y2BZC6_ARAVE|nr:hypothetical protein AVEN_84954-1 [Araneus ventricosus]
MTRTTREPELYSSNFCPHQQEEIRSTTDVMCLNPSILGGSLKESDLEPEESVLELFPKSKFCFQGILVEGETRRMNISAVESRLRKENGTRNNPDIMHERSKNRGGGTVGFDRNRHKLVHRACVYIIRNSNFPEHLGDTLERKVAVRQRSIMAIREPETGFMEKLQIVPQNLQDPFVNPKPSRRLAILAVRGDHTLC